ncbi:MAG: hypothetical protein QXR85_00735 [Candidatus Micrarchaeaceae archaeon]
MKAFALLALLSVLPLAGAQTITIPSYSAFSNWLPVVFVAILLSLVIASVYYIFGYLLNNKKVKSRAIAEFIQAIGTGILVVIIVWLLSVIGTTMFSPISVVSAQHVSSICNSLSNSQIRFLNSNEISPTNTICNTIISPLASGSGSSSLTRSIDYGVAATYIVIANVTNQAINNLNAFYVYDGTISFLRALTSVSGFGTAGGTAIYFDYTPLAGYSFLSKMSLAVGIVSALSIDSFIMQLLVILILLVTWPYILAAGIIFRATPYTRRLGGLLIGIVIALLIIWPLIFLFEYASLGTTESSFPIGSNVIPYTPIYELAPNGNVLVYGATSGFELLTNASASSVGCPAGDYVYEGTCGNISTVSSPPDCKAEGQISQFQLCQNGYTTDNTLCPSSSKPYVYESVCGDPNSSAPSGACYSGSELSEYIPMCPASPTPHNSGIALFQLPNATQTVKYYSCWPLTGNLLTFELATDAFYLIPFYGLGLATFTSLSAITGYFPSAIPGYPPTISCTPEKAFSAGIAFTNIYGITGITAFILPLLNILIVYGAAIGLSKILGGESDILGLSRFI